MKPSHATPEPHPDPTLLWRRATERYGLSPSSSICQHIRRLAEHWNDFVYASVERAFANCEAARNAMQRVADHIPSPDAFAGELPLALLMMLTGKLAPVLIQTSRFTLQTIISGLPGRGNTFFCRLLLAMLVRVAPHTRVVIFDPNRSYASTCGDPSHWLSVSWDALKLGLFSPPPGYLATRWLTESLDLLSRGELLHSRYLIARLLDGLVESATRAAAGGPVRMPSLLCLRDALASMRPRPWTAEERYRQTALNLVDGKITATGSVFDCSAGMESLVIDTRMRISTEGLAPIESLELVINHLIHYLCRRRETEPLIEPPELHTLVVVEEAQMILQPRSESIAYYQQLLLRARSLGVGLVLLTQDISRIDPLVLAACSNYFIFGQSSSTDKRTCQNILDLSNRETAMLGDLGVGECFIRFLGHPTFPWPFLARIPDVRSL